MIVLESISLESRSLEGWTLPMSVSRRTLEIFLVKLAEKLRSVESEWAVSNYYLAGQVVSSSQEKGTSQSERAAYASAPSIF